MPNNLTPEQLQAILSLTPNEMGLVNYNGVLYQPGYDTQYYGEGESKQGPLNSLVQIGNEDYNKTSTISRFDPITGNFLYSDQYTRSPDYIGQMLPGVLLAAATGGLGLAGTLGSGLSSTLGLGLGSAGAGALGGATIGGLSSAAMGGNPITGALLGGAGGYVKGGGLNGLFGGGSDLQAAMDADIAGGMVPEFGTNSAYDAFMNEAMTPAARTAIETMINSGNGAWLGENVPSGVPEWDQAFTNAGGTFDTAYINPTDLTNVPEPGFENWTPNGTDVSNVGPDTVPTPKVVTPDTKTVTPDLKTVTDLAKVISLGGGLLGGSKLVSNALTPTPTGTTTAPTQTVPVGNQDYYNAIQQYYNAYMPAQPRDIATPLQNWYSKKYGA